MEIFKVVLGASRVEFTMSHDGKQYVGAVNGLIIAASTDYESVRAVIAEGINANKSEILH